MEPSCTEFTDLLDGTAPGSRCHLVDRTWIDDQRIPGKREAAI